MDDMSLFVLGYRAGKKKGGSAAKDSRKSILDSADVIGTVELPLGWKINIKWTGQMSFIQNQYKPFPIFRESVWAEFYNGETFKFACPINAALTFVQSQDYYIQPIGGTTIYLGEKVRNSNVSVNTISFKSTSETPTYFRFTDISHDTRAIGYDKNGEIIYDNLKHNAKDEATGSVIFAGYSTAICRGNADDYSSDILELYSVLASLW